MTFSEHLRISQLDSRSRLPPPSFARYALVKLKSNCFNSLDCFISQLFLKHLKFKFFYIGEAIVPPMQGHTKKKKTKNETQNFFIENPPSSLALLAKKF